MKALAIAILVFVGMFIFCTKPLVKVCGGSMKMYAILLIDLTVAVAAYIIAS